VLRVAGTAGHAAGSGPTGLLGLLLEVVAGDPAQEKRFANAVQRCQLYRAFPKPGITSWASLRDVLTSLQLEHAGVPAP